MRTPARKKGKWHKKRRFLTFLFSGGSSDKRRGRWWYKQLHTKRRMGPHRWYWQTIYIINAKNHFKSSQQMWDGRQMQLINFTFVSNCACGRTKLSPFEVLISKKLLLSRSQLRGGTFLTFDLITALLTYIYFLHQEFLGRRIAWLTIVARSRTWTSPSPYI